MSQSTKNRTNEDRLQELIAERDRYQQWLDSLQSERDEVPDHIYERISADYEKRLQEAVDALREHLDTLESRLEERRTALEETKETLKSGQDELIESEIRHRVGEFTDEQWKKVESSLKSDIAKAESRRDELEAEVEHLEATIAQVRQPAGTGDAEDVGEPEEEAEGDSMFLEVLAEATATAEANGASANGSGGGGAAPAQSVREHDAIDTASRRPRRPTGLRTLRCETCGTFNLPEAMFCEACGADLPAS